ncbi:hypothetical protein Tco_0978096 [Tanacetum coccineum]|uniref:Uncharacterized protein n=1 Tax=Tanacetum coccineum TaxID=301880 RepID=A0ABQ5EM36_9ASTR
MLAPKQQFLNVLGSHTKFGNPRVLGFLKSQAQKDGEDNYELVFEMAQQPMRSEKELCPTNVRFHSNKINVRINPDELQDEPLSEGVVTSTNVDFTLLLWEHFRFQINKHKNLATKHEIIPYLRFTKLVIRHLLSHNPNLNKRLDYTPHFIGDEARLEKLKYVAKGERKPTFGMPIPKAIISSSTLRHGMGKGLMRRSDIPTLKKKKDDVPRHLRSITAADNLLQNLDEALKYAKMVSMEETQNQEKERRSKHRHVRIVLEKQVNKEVNEGYQHLKVKLKAKEQPSPYAQLLLNLRLQNKKSNKQEILEEIKRKDTGEGSGAAPESPNHSNSSDDSSESANDDTTASERESYHDTSDNNSENGEDNFVINPHDKELEQPPKELPPLSPSVTTTSAEDYTRLEKTVHDMLKKNPVNMFQSSSTPAFTFTEYELNKKLYDMMQNSRSFLDHKKHLDLYNALINLMDIDESTEQGDTPSQHKRSHDVHDPFEDHEGEKRSKRRQKDDVIPRPTKERLKRIIHTMKEKIFKKDKITKEDVEDKIDWINPEGDRFHHDMSKPLPLTGPPGRKRIPAARYEDEGIEEMIPTLWSPSIQKYNRYAELGIYQWDEHRQWFYKGNIGHKSRHEVYSKLNIRSVQNIKVNKKFRYAYLEEIMVIRTDVKEYKFAEANFPNLNQNDIKDLYLFKIQNKIRNIKGAEEYDMINALKICLHQKTLYTILSHPKGVVYEGTDYRKRLMKADELNKFCDGMLNKILIELCPSSCTPDVEALLPVSTFSLTKFSTFKALNELLRLQICPRLPNQEFVEPPSEEDMVHLSKTSGTLASVICYLRFTLIICTSDVLSVPDRVKFRGK